jgi:hypothetical protein
VNGLPLYKPHQIIDVEHVAHLFAVPEDSDVAAEQRGR